MTLASEGVFVLRHPNDSLAGLYRNLAARVVPNLLPTADPPRAAV
jgi:hypothetical protein